MKEPFRVFFKDFWNYTRSFAARQNRLITLTLFLIVAAGIVIRLQFISQPIRYDEALTRIISFQPLSKVLTQYQVPNNHLLHSLLVHISCKFFGDTLAFLRLPAFVSGVLLIPASFVFSNILFDRHTAVMSAALVSSSSILIEYSALARGYTMLLLIFVLLMTVSAYLIRTNNMFAWVLFSVLAALGLYTIPTMLYPLGVAVFWIMLSALARKGTPLKFTLRRLFFFTTLAGIITLLLYLPIIINGSYRLALSIPEMKRLSWGSFFNQLAETSRLAWAMWMRDIPMFISILLVAGFLISLICWHKSSEYRFHLLIPAFLWLFPVLLIQRVISPLRVRDWLFLLPLFLAASSKGLCCPIKRILKSFRKTDVLLCAIALSLCGVLCITVLSYKGITRSEEGGRCNEAKDIVEFLKPRLREGDRLLAYCPCDITVGYYREKAGLSPEYTHANILQGKRIFFIVSTNPVYGQSVKSVLRYGNIEYEKVRKTLRLVKRIGDAEIYECRLK